MKIERNLAPSQDELSELNRNLWSFISKQSPGLPDDSEDKAFLFTITEQSHLLGGISGNVYWNGLEIDVLWVDQRYRGRGIGKQLLLEAEDYAKENGAVISFPKTVDAKEFYEKNYYKIYGQLEDRPIGSILYHMKKRLDDQKSL
jgi:GNAT superfamily N-acetyltransferase